MSQGNHTLFNSFDVIVLTGVAVATIKVAVERITLLYLYLQSSDSGIFVFGFIQLETQKFKNCGVIAPTCYYHEIIQNVVHLRPVLNITQTYQ